MEILSQYGVEVTGQGPGKGGHVKLDDPENVKRFDRAIGAQMAQFDSQKTNSGIGHWWRNLVDNKYYQEHKDGKIDPANQALIDKTTTLAAARKEIKAYQEEQAKAPVAPAPEQRDHQQPAPVAAAQPLVVPTVVPAAMTPPVDVDKTAAVLPASKKAVPASADGKPSAGEIMKIQQALKDVGDYKGEINGQCDTRFTESLQKAIVRAQMTDAYDTAHRNMYRIRGDKGLVEGIYGSATDVAFRSMDHEKTNGAWGRLADALHNTGEQRLSKVYTPKNVDQTVKEVAVERPYAVENLQNVGVAEGVEIPGPASAAQQQRAAQRYAAMSRTKLGDSPTAEEAKPKASQHTHESKSTRTADASRIKPVQPIS